MRVRTLVAIGVVLLTGAAVACTPTASPAPPSAPTAAPDLTPATDTGVSNSDDLTGTTTPDFQGTCPTSVTVTILVGGTPSGSQVCAGGSYRITVAVSEGTHSITSTFTDLAGLVSDPSPALTVTVDTTVLNGVQDTTAPVLVSLSTSLSAVDTSTGPATIHAAARITDDLSGVSYGNASWTSPSRMNRINLNLACGQTGYPVDFTAPDCTTELPQFSEIGTWTFDHLYVVDRLGNTRYYYPADLTAAGIPVPADISNGH